MIVKINTLRLFDILKHYAALFDFRWEHDYDACTFSIISCEPLSISVRNRIEYIIKEWCMYNDNHNIVYKNTRTQVTESADMILKELVERYEKPSEEILEETLQLYSHARSLFDRKDGVL